MGESSVLKARLPRRPPLALLSPQEGPLAELHLGRLELAPSEQEVTCLGQRRELEQQLAAGGLHV